MFSFRPPCDSLCIDLVYITKLWDQTIYEMFVAWRGEQRLNVLHGKGRK